MGGRQVSARPGNTGLRLIVCRRIRGLPPAAIALFLIPLLSSLRAYVPMCLLLPSMPRCLLLYGHGPQLARWARRARRSEVPTLSLPSKSAGQPLHGPQLGQQPEQIGDADGAVGVEIPQTNAVNEQNPPRAAVRAPVVILECPHGQVADSVAVEITQRGHRPAKVIAIIQDAGKATLSVADLLVRLDCPVGVEEQHPHRTAVGPPVVIPYRPDSQVAHAVAVAAPAAHRRPENSAWPVRGFVPRSGRPPPTA